MNTLDICPDNIRIALHKYIISLTNVPDHLEIKDLVMECLGMCANVGEDETCNRINNQLIGPGKFKTIEQPLPSIRLNSIGEVCRRCKSTNIRYYLKQIRSADEPMTPCFECECGCKWMK